MTVSELEGRYLLEEAGHLSALTGRYFEAITATERYALAGAAALAAFSVTAIGESQADMRLLISAAPFVILALAGLRCLTIYMVIRAILTYIERIENTVLSDDLLGYQRHNSTHGEANVRRGIEVVSGMFWVLAVLASLAFWLLVNDLP